MLALCRVWLAGLLLGICIVSLAQTEKLTIPIGKSLFVFFYSITSMARIPRNYENMFEINIVRANEC